MSVIPETKEVFSSQIPALQVLMAMGYEYLSPAQALAYRGGQTSEVLLRSVLIAELRKRRFNWKGPSRFALSPAFRVAGLSPYRWVRLGLLSGLLDVNIC